MKKRQLFASLIVVAVMPAMAGIHINAGGTSIGVGTAGVRINTPMDGMADIETDNMPAMSSQGGVDRNYTINCTSRSPNATISGADNTVRVTGRCQTISIQGASNTVTAQAANQLKAYGADNKVTIEQVDSIVAQGADVQIRYHSGLTGKTPRISVSGADARAVRY